MEEVLLPVPFQAVLMTCLIEEDTLEMPLWIRLMPCVTFARSAASFVSLPSAPGSRQFSLLWSPALPLWRCL